MTQVRVTIIGAGVIGLATAYHLLKAGAAVTVIDRDPEGDKTSFGNAGGIAVTEVVPASASGTFWRVFGWMVDPLGPLAVRPTYAPRLIPWLVSFARVGRAKETERISQALAAINARVYEDLLPMLGETGLQGEIHHEGALSLYESEAGYRRDLGEWDCKRAHGIECQPLTGDEARAMEPALGALVHSAVFTPQWSHINDPRQLMAGLRSWLSRHGVAFYRGEVRHIESRSASKISIHVEGESIEAENVVIAAGAWSALLATRLGDSVLLESERGYNMTLPNPGIAVKRTLVFAERKFVATPLSCGLRVGGAAEFGGLKAPPNYKRSHGLVELARRYLPNLQTAGGITWAGHRPATPDSLPVLSRSERHPHVFYAFGHGHLGLTQAATTGRLVQELVFQQRPSIDIAPYRIGRFR